MEPLAPWLNRLAAFLTFAAAALHGAVTQAHFEEWWGYGVFFVVAALAQALYGFFLIALGPPGMPTPPGRSPQTWARIHRVGYVAGIIGNLAIIALYLVTRTIGIPFAGPEQGSIEPIGMLDIISKVTELALVALLVFMLRIDAAGLRKAQ